MNGQMYLIKFLDKHTKSKDRVDTQKREAVRGTASRI